MPVKYCFTGNLISFQFWKSFYFSCDIGQQLRIPHIIGMILAGLAVGEHGFNILARDSSFELFGKVGLYYIMFLAGLEMNMGDFKETRNKALVLGLLAFIVPEETTGLSFEQTAYDSQHQQCECVRHCRSSYRNAYATMT